MTTIEKQKDEILQQINDILDKENWGGNDDSLIVEVAFIGHLDYQIRLRKKFKKIVDKAN